MHTQDQDQAKKKDDPNPAPQAVTAAPAPQLNATTPRASGAQAAPVVSHWAEAGGQHKGGPAAQQQPAKADGGEAKPHMVHDERYSEDADVVQDGHGRILSLQVANGQTRIMISLGRKQGVHPAMMGYVKKGGGMLADFQIEEVGDRVAYATVDVTPDQLKDHQEVVVNPSSMPKSAEAQQDMKARVLDASIVSNRIKIMIGRGSNAGARSGMRGALLGSSGRPIIHFAIDEVHSTHSTAFVDEVNLDEVRSSSGVILNPSS